MMKRVVLACTSETMSDDSRTSPHCVHTASPLDGSTSIDVEPHDEHLSAALEDFSDDAPVAAEGPEVPAKDTLELRYCCQDNCKNKDREDPI